MLTILRGFDCIAVHSQNQIKQLANAEIIINGQNLHCSALPTPAEGLDQKNTGGELLTLQLGK